MQALADYAERRRDDREHTARFLRCAGALRSQRPAARTAAQSGLDVGRTPADRARCAGEFGHGIPLMNARNLLDVIVVGGGAVGASAAAALAQSGFDVALVGPIHPPHRPKMRHLMRASSRCRRPPCALSNASAHGRCRTRAPSPIATWKCARATRAAFRPASSWPNRRSAGSSSCVRCRRACSMQRDPVWPLRTRHASSTANAANARHESNSTTVRACAPASWCRPKAGARRCVNQRVSLRMCAITRAAPSSRI
ncbi:MAG: FAD-dependent oxidoreductase [Xanthomonadales bacterium]|nr:FAD-dependent oxidoreductase [Xanthomonadales bacterium]